MKRTALFYFLFPFFILSICGCVALVVGGTVGALGGHAASKDMIQADSDKPYDQLWNGALNVSRMRGTIRQEDAAKGYIEADIEKTKVWIRMVRLTQATTRMRISCRRYHLPNLELAQDLFVKIMEEAK
ncbi:MAG: DUF3568 family protein [Candidatus Omnitrophota bacterium]